MIAPIIPWLEIAMVAPLFGACMACFAKDRERVRRIAIWFSGISLAAALIGWLEFLSIAPDTAAAESSPLAIWRGQGFSFDTLNAPLIPLTTLMFFLAPLATLRTKQRRFPFRMNLVSSFLALAALGCRTPWVIVLLLVIQPLPLILEIRSRGKSARGFAIHMVLFAVLLIAGWILIDTEDSTHEHSVFAIGLLIAAILIRSGCAPLHCWLTDLFEKATLGSSLLFTAPMIGVYAAVRLLLPIAPDWALRIIAFASLFTAVYSSGLALVQTETRRFFSYLLLSNASLVLVGLEVATTIGLTGALSTWLATSLSLTGFGLTLRAIETRSGRISLRSFHGLYPQMPLLATFFLITGLAIVGFPGTVGFAGIELIVEGVVEVFPVIGVMVVIAAALNSIAILRVYFRLFAGKRLPTTCSMQARWSEKFAVLVLSGLIFVGGIYPQPGVASRYQAAKQIMEQRTVAPETVAETDALPNPSRVTDFR